MALEITRLQDDIEVPQANDEVAGAGGELIAFGIEDKLIDWQVMGVFERAAELPVFGVPEIDIAIEPAGEKRLAVFAEGCGALPAASWAALWSFVLIKRRGSPILKGDPGMGVV